MSQGAEQAGKVGMFAFANPGALEKSGDNLFRNGVEPRGRAVRPTRGCARASWKART